jgi:pimeloyl-ACP methyl ester carboxylesterase
MGHVEVDGLRISYERAGTGPPLILLHGYVGDGPTTWRPQLEGLSDEFTVIAWDAPGTGGSDDPPEDFGMAGYADCLSGFIRSLGFERAHVAGLSFGGALALALGGRHPAVPSSLVLASAYAGWRGSLSAEESERRVTQAMALSALPADVFVSTLLPTMFSEETPREVVEQFGASMRAFHPSGFRAMALAASEDLRDVLPRIAVPTLLVYGADDTRAPRAVADHLHASIPACTLTVIPGRGHLVNREAPAEFNDAVRRFLHAVGA